MRFRHKQNKTIPFKKAVTRILIYTLLISGSAAMALLYYFHIKEIQLQDERYTLSTLSQKGELSSAYLAELLQLSVDRPTHFHHFNTEEGRKKLLASPLIRSAEVKKFRPSTLSINYTIRQPVALLGDFTNTAIDGEGVLIPLEPFFSRGEMPEIVMGDLGNRISWGEQLAGDTLEKVRNLLRAFSQEKDGRRSILRKIDLSKASSPSCGAREIVAVVEEQRNGAAIILRLNPDNIQGQLANYRVLSDYLFFRSAVIPEMKIVDLRIPQLAFTN